MGLPKVIEMAAWVLNGFQGEMPLCTCNLTASTQMNSDALQIQAHDLATREWDRFDFGPGSIWMACEYNLPGRFEYVAQCDNGCYERKTQNFELAPGHQCQQKSANNYPHACVSPKCGDPTCVGACVTQCDRLPAGSSWSSHGLRSEAFKESCNEVVKYDRSHQIPTNHVDYDKTLIDMSNSMINISPQVSRMRRGAWRYTEKLIECWRDIEVLHVMGGSVWNDGNNERNMEGRNDWFRQSHGIQTPVYFWKIIKAKEHGVIASRLGIHYVAFWIPNTEAAIRRNIDSYVVTISQLEKNLRQYRQSMTFEEINRDACYGGSSCAAWPVPENCDLHEFRIPFE